MKKIWIYSSIILLIAITAYLIVNDSEEKSKENISMAKKDHSNTKNLWEGINQENIKKMGNFFNGKNLYSYSELISLVEKGKLNLRSEIWKLRRQCPKNLEPHECNFAVMQFLKKNFPPEFASMFEKYLFYEKIIRESQSLKELKDEERYKKLKELRREIFPSEYVKLIFGREEAKMEFSSGLKDFMKSTENLSGDERVHEYEKYQKKIYGDFYEGITENESSFDQYQMELSLREKQLNQMPLNEKNASTKELRIKYFGKEGAERLEKLDETLKKEKENESSYLKEKEKLLAENENLSLEEKEKLLDNLRGEYFGKDAENYKQREIYREYINKQK